MAVVEAAEAFLSMAVPGAAKASAEAALWLFP
jgi:hypothetical protein